MSVGLDLYRVALILSLYRSYLFNMSNADSSQGASDLGLSGPAAEDAKANFYAVAHCDPVHTLCAAPQAIGILGECMLLTSMKNAKRIPLHSSDGRY
jgi:hypothetical protein